MKTPTATGTSGHTRRSGRGAGFWLVLVAALFGIALLGGGPPDDGTPLSPDSTGPLGVKGLVLLLEDLGADVDVSSAPPGEDVDVTLVLEDNLADAQRGEVDQWVADGGRLVVADPASAFTPVLVADSTVLGGLFEATLEPRECTIDALAGIGRVDTAGGVLYEPPSGADRCFGDEEAAFVVAEGRSAGAVVSIGGAGPFTNQVLGREDNAVLAANLLAPHPGTRVRLLEPRRAGSGDEGLGDLVAPRVKQSLLQLAIAFGVYALWRARRLGKPVVEPQPVQIAGSELVAAVADLLQQTRSPQRAAEILRQDLRRALCDRLGLPRAAAPEVVASVTAKRTGVDAEQVHAALVGTPVNDESDLVALATLIDSIRKEVLHGRAT